MSNRQVPTSVESPRGKLVYLSLATRDSASVEELHGDLGVPRITLYSVLKTLQRRGLVDRDGDRYVTARPA
ncbi:MAG: helix-turn-helix domain-containing protein [Halobacterium sp.]